MKVGKLLKEDLGKAKIRPNQLANLSGVPRQKISEYLGKGRNPSEGNLKKMLAALDLTDRRKQEYLKAHRAQTESTLARKKGFGTKQKIAAATRKLSQWYDVDVEYNHEFSEMLEENKDGTYIEKLTNMKPEDSYRELMKLAENLKKEEGTLGDKNADSPLALEVSCTVTLIPKPTNSFPAVRWKMNLNSFNVASVPQVETMIDGLFASDGETEFLHGNWIAENAATGHILQSISWEAGVPYFGIYALALQKLEERIQLYESQGGQKIGNVSVPLSLIIDLWQNFSDANKGDWGAAGTVRLKLQSIFTLWMQGIIDWKVNKEFIRYFEKLISQYSRSA